MRLDEVKRLMTTTDVDEANAALKDGWGFLRVETTSVRLEKDLVVKRFEFVLWRGEQP